MWTAIRWLKRSTRAKPVAALVARSETPISGMSAPVERMLAKFGCTLEGARQAAGG